MRHRTAARRGEGGGWHYVDMGRHGGHPLGYCAEHESHHTETQARECYSAFLRERTIRLDDHRVKWTSCQGRDGDQRCPNPTQSSATYDTDGYHSLPLCPDHMTEAQVISLGRLDQPCGDSWQT